MQISVFTHVTRGGHVLQLPVLSSFSCHFNEEMLLCVARIPGCSQEHQVIDSQSSHLIALDEWLEHLTVPQCLELFLFSHRKQPQTELVGHHVSTSFDSHELLETRAYESLRMNLRIHFL